MKWLILLCLCGSSYCFGQSLQIDHYGANPSMELRELWKLQIAGNTAADLKGIWLKAEVRKAGSTVYEATTETLPLSQGLNVLDQFKVQIASQHFSEMELESYVTSTGKLPTGHYTACVTVFQEQVELKTLCIEIRSENYSPPMLIYPFNGQELSNTAPVLSWLAPVPNAIDGIKYSIKLVEQFEGQTAQEALLRNPSQMQVNDVLLTSMPYPPSALALEVDKTYAWQVEAFVGSTSIGHTQVWSFKVVEVSDQLKKRIRNQDYVELKVQMASNPVAVIQKLNVKFVESGSRSKFGVSVFNESGEEIKGRLSTLKNNSGDNYHTIDFSKLRGIKHKDLYTVVFTNTETGQRYKLNLQYLDPDQL